MAKKLTLSDIPPDTIIICPRCKTKNAPAVQNCLNCKEDLRPVKLGILNKLGKTPNGETQKLIKCSFCGASNPKWAISCHYCANSFKKSIWGHKRTVEDLRERYLASIIALFVLGGVSFSIAIWQNEEGEMTFGFVAAEVAFLMFLGRHWGLTSKSKESTEAIAGHTESLPPPQPVPTGIERPAIRLRRRFMIVVEVGILLVLFGIGSVVGAFFFDNHTHSATTTIHGGYFVYFSTNSQLARGHLSGSYSVSPGDVSIYIFTSDQFESYSTNGFSDSIYQGEGSSGSFSVDLPGVGTYYLVMNHSQNSSLRSTNQNLNLSYSLSGIGFGYLISGIGVLAVGVVPIISGIRTRRKVRNSAAEQKIRPSQFL